MVEKEKKVKVHVCVLSPHNIPKDDSDIVTGCEIRFVGYPAGNIDSIHFTPIVRVGALATPLRLDFSGQPKFLIDASVYHGSSGSPVIIYDEVRFRMHAGMLQSQSERYLLLGVLIETLCLPVDGKMRVDEVSHMKAIPVIDQVINLGVVVKAQKIQEVIDYHLSGAPSAGSEGLIPLKKWKELRGIK